MAVENWDSETILGFVDEGATCSRFISEKGSEPKVLKNASFKKDNYKGADAFAAVMGKFLPTYTFLDVPVKVDSLKYEDLIDVVKKHFPDLNSDEEPIDLEEVPVGEAGSKQPAKMEQIPIPEDDEGDVDYSKP